MNRTTRKAVAELLARLNPELLRGWRAEATPLRLAIALLLSAGVAWCIQLAWGWSAFGGAGAAAFAIFSFVVTPIRIVGAIAEEHARHTWQRQRMSALSPVQMMLGKAFGATGLTDLAALCALIFWGMGVYLTEGAALGLPVEQLAEALAHRRAAFPLDAWLMICANLFARFLALALAIRNCDRDRSKAVRGRSSVIAIQLSLLLFGPLAVLQMARPPAGTDKDWSEALWFGFLPMDHDAFWALSGLAFVAFAACWCWCAARETLSGGRLFAFEAVVVSLGVGLWWAGTAYGALDTAGSALLETAYSPARLTTATLLLALAVTAYLWGVAERADRRSAREFLAAPSLRNAPAWLLIVALAAAAAAVHLVSGAFYESGEYGYFQLNFWVVSLLGFVVRDLGILFLVLSGRVKRWPELVALASWLVLGIFVPSALVGAGASAGGFDLHLLFSPVALQEPTVNLVIGVVSAWLQAALVVMWLVRRGQLDRKSKHGIGNP